MKPNYGRLGGAERGSSQEDQPYDVNSALESDAGLRYLGRRSFVTCSREGWACDARRFRIVHAECHHCFAMS